MKTNVTHRRVAGFLLMVGLVAVRKLNHFLYQPFPDQPFPAYSGGDALQEPLRFPDCGATGAWVTGKQQRNVANFLLNGDTVQVRRLQKAGRWNR